MLWVRWTAWEEFDDSYNFTHPGSNEVGPHRRMSVGGESAGAHLDGAQLPPYGGSDLRYRKLSARFGPGRHVLRGVWPVHLSHILHLEIDGDKNSLTPPHSTNIQLLQMFYIAGLSKVYLLEIVNDGEWSFKLIFRVLVFLSVDIVWYWSHFSININTINFKTPPIKFMRIIASW